MKTQSKVIWDEDVISPTGTMTWIMPDNSMDNDTRNSVCKGDIVEFDAEKLALDPIKETLCFITYMKTGATDCRMAVVRYGAVSLRPLNPNKKSYLLQQSEVMLHRVVRITKSITAH